MSRWLIAKENARGGRRDMHHHSIVIYRMVVVTGWGGSGNTRIWSLYGTSFLLAYGQNRGGQYRESEVMGNMIGS